MEYFKMVALRAYKGMPIVVFGFFITSIVSLDLIGSKSLWPRVPIIILKLWINSSIASLSARGRFDSVGVFAFSMLISLTLYTHCN